MGHHSGLARPFFQHVPRRPTPEHGHGAAAGLQGKRLAEASAAEGTR